MFQSLLSRILRPSGTSAWSDYPEESSFVQLRLAEHRSWEKSYPDVPPPEPRMTIQLFVALWTCGEIYGEDTPAIAADLLEAGYDSPSLRRLAGEMLVTCQADATGLMERIMRESGLPAPFPPRRARLLVTRQISRLVIAGARDPWAAAADLKMIWNRDPDDHDVRALLDVAEDDVWDPVRQRYRPALGSDYAERFARLASITDDQIRMRC